jgi:hypothetical protein
MDNIFGKIAKLKSIRSLELIVNAFIKLVKVGAYNIDDMIIVFDIDDTLVTIDLSDDYHVSIAMAYYKKGLSLTAKVLGNLEYAILDDKYPCEEESTLAILDLINKNKINCIVVTSRQLHLVKVTIKNFIKNGILQKITDNKFYMNYIKEQFNKKSSEEPMREHLKTRIKAETINDISVGKNALYTNNILFVSDQPKGTKFDELLKIMGKSYKIIVVVDDTLGKIESFFDIAGDSHIIGLLYTFINS